MSSPAEPPRPDDFDAAASALDTLDRLTGDIRRELVQIRREMVQEAARYSDLRYAQLVEANEQLLQATMRAERRANEATAELEEVSRSSQFDTLTDTPNRALMTDRLRGALALARRHDACLAILFLDLDGFKLVNDTAGHAAGDEVLRRVAARLRAAVRESDTVSRQGGDEFLVLLPEVAGRAASARTAQKVLLALAEPIMLDGEAFTVSASIGIALRPVDGEDADGLIARADQAMYDAKRAGGNCYRFVDGSPAQDGVSAPPRLSSRQHGVMHNLREVNEKLLVAALRAQELLDAAEVARERHARALAVLAHELRNPLTPIRTAGHWLKLAHGGDAGIHKAGEVIDRQVAHMSRLIDDLLDGSRAGATGFRLQPAEVALLGILERSVEVASARMLARRQTVDARLPAGTLRVNGDAMRLEQVFCNLLDNASKYTPPGGRIELAAVEAQGQVSITIRDNGIGISADALPNIFELFVQEERTVGADAGGLGIGLAVVRELVLAHGGTVEARSAGPGTGSEFEVRLPVCPRADA
ncbi:diguanylate cyclase domain-containing protein [Ideonella sp. BN130291]|uniref:diguanylate cyclase domain-containing protein n=1 Tax=Ideonella sp. BN130291 TaxID=3112940 RepID=UPI002E26D944|nr:diguanylate cyclase [Ideonella sp. BN130291]